MTLNLPIPSRRRFRSLADRFAIYHAQNPHVYLAFTRFAFEAITAGRTRLSAGLIAERIRWESMISGNDGFKINNDYRAFYARRFMADHPEHGGIFETRVQYS